MSETYRHVMLNGIDFAYIDVGDGPAVLCLHGFPDTAHSFDAITPALVAAGYRVIAPFLRGYAPTSLAADGDYSMLAVARDVLAWIDWLGGGPLRVIGHDWGAFAAYTAANIAPQKFEQLALMCVPHMHATTFTLAQMRKSWYVMFFQLPRIPERVVPRQDFRFIDRLYAAWSPGWNCSDDAARPVKRSLARPENLAAALGYYRSMIMGASREQREVMSRRTAVETLYFCGEDDGSVGVEQFSRVDECFAQPVELVCMPGVGHFPHRERPAEVARRLARFFDRVG